MINFVKNKPIAFICIFASVISLPIFLWLSWGRELTSFENVILQYIILGIALLFAFGLSLAYGIERGHARSAFRRLLSLYRSIEKVDETLYDSNLSDSDKILMIKGLVFEQASVANDSVEDWREIIPREEVSSLMGSVDKK